MHGLSIRMRGFACVPLPVSFSPYSSVVRSVFLGLGVPIVRSCALCLCVPVIPHCLRMLCCSCARRPQELRQLAQTVREEEEALGETEAQKREMKARLERTQKIDGAVEKLIGTLAETVRELEGKKKAKGDMRALQERVDGQRDRHGELETQKKVRGCACMCFYVCVSVLHCDRACGP